MMTAADCLLSEENTHKKVFFTYLIHNKGKTILVSIWIKIAARGRRIKSQIGIYEFYCRKKSCQNERVLNVNKVSRIFSWNCHIFMWKKYRQIERIFALLCRIKVNKLSRIIWWFFLLFFFYLSKRIFWEKKIVKLKGVLPAECKQSFTNFLTISVLQREFSAKKNRQIQSSFALSSLNNKHK